MRFARSLLVEQHRRELDARLNGKTFWCQFIAGLNVPSRAYPYHCEPPLVVRERFNTNNKCLSFFRLSRICAALLLFGRSSMCAFAMDRSNCSLPVYLLFTYERDPRLTYFFASMLGPTMCTRTQRPSMCVCDDTNADNGDSIIATKRCDAMSCNSHCNENAIVCIHLTCLRGSLCPSQNTNKYWSVNNHIVICRRSVFAWEIVIFPA